MDSIYYTVYLDNNVIGGDRVFGIEANGFEVARLAKAFRMTVYATKRTPVVSDNLDRLFKPNELNKMLQICDFVVQRYL